MYILQDQKIKKKKIIQTFQNNKTKNNNKINNKKESNKKKIRNNPNKIKLIK